MCVCVCVCVCTCAGTQLCLFATPWTVAHRLLYVIDVCVCVCVCVHVHVQVLSCVSLQPHGL